MKTTFATCSVLALVAALAFGSYQEAVGKTGAQILLEVFRPVVDNIIALSSVRN